MFTSCGSNTEDVSICHITGTVNGCYCDVVPFFLCKMQSVHGLFVLSFL